MRLMGLFKKHLKSINGKDDFILLQLMEKTFTQYFCEKNKQKISLRPSVTQMYIYMFFFVCFVLIFINSRNCSHVIPHKFSETKNASKQRITSLSLYLTLVTWVNRMLNVYQAVMTTRYFESVCAFLSKICRPSCWIVFQYQIFEDKLLGQNMPVVSDLLPKRVLVGSSENRFPLILFILCT